MECVDGLGTSRHSKLKQTVDLGNQNWPSHPDCSKPRTHLIKLFRHGNHTPTSRNHHSGWRNRWNGVVLELIRTHKFIGWRQCVCLWQDARPQEVPLFPTGIRCHTDHNRRNPHHSRYWWHNMDHTLASCPCFTTSLCVAVYQQKATDLQKQSFYCGNSLASVSWR